MKRHGGVVIPEQPAKGEKAQNGFAEEAGKTIREYACTLLSQMEDSVDDTLGVQHYPVDSPLGGNLSVSFCRRQGRGNGIRKIKRAHVQSGTNTDGGKGLVPAIG